MTVIYFYRLRGIIKFLNFQYVYSLDYMLYVGREAGKAIMVRWDGGISSYCRMTGIFMAECDYFWQDATPFSI